MARDYDGSGSGFRIGNIQVLYHELLSRGHRVLMLRGSIDPHLVEQADLILQDPLYAFGIGTRGDDLDRFLYENAAGRCHLLRTSRKNTVDKRAMHALAVKLGVRVPAIYRFEAISAAQLPVAVCGVTPK